MKLRLNLMAGLANSIWTALVGLAVVPFYLKYLGIEGYGLIGFFVTMQTMLQLLDFGLVPTINREVARHSAAGNLKEAGKLLHTLAIVYWSMAGIIVLLIAALAPFIAEYWLQPKHLSYQTIEHAVMLMGLVVAFRWPIGLYQSALIGAEKLIISSGVSITMVTFGNLGALAVLAWVSPTIEAFFIWQACTGLVYAAAIRWMAWRIIGRLKDISFDVYELKRIWRFSAGMTGIGLSALVFTQLDKIILSKMLGLSEFGHYMLATVVVSGLYVLVTPVFNVIYPRFSSLVVGGDTAKLTNLYQLGTRMLATILFPIAMVLVIFAGDLVRLWTGNQDIALMVAPIIALMAIGSALNGVMHFPYALQLAYGMTRLPLTINAILMVILIPLIIFFALSYGALGGAMAWFILHVLYVLLGTWLTHRNLLKGTGRIWLFQSVGIPLILSLLVGLIGYFMLQRAEYSGIVRLICGAVLALIAVLLSVSVSSPLLAVVLKSVGWKKKILTA
ncbi:MAG: oligosaccharide flippase family protein [Bacteroidetes bacterium]|nr:oligosaccharide flippase family protein [Bacteroidota bacterium]